MNYRLLFKLRCRGWTQQDIAEEMGVTRKCVNENFRKIIKMSDEEFDKFFKEVMD